MMMEYEKSSSDSDMEADIQKMQKLREEIKNFGKVKNRLQKKKNPAGNRVKQICAATGLMCFILLLLLMWKKDWLQTGPSSQNSQLEAVELIRVVDGDTIIVTYKGEEARVRLLTVNCQESVHPDAERNNAEGEAASQFTKTYLADYPVLYLQFDREMYDRYDRLLAYVWLEDEVSVDSRNDVEQYMFNAILLKEGYAETAVYEPNHRYAEWFYEIEAESDNNKN